MLRSCHRPSTECHPGCAPAIEMTKKQEDLFETEDLMRGQGQLNIGGIMDLGDFLVTTYRSTWLALFCPIHTWIDVTREFSNQRDAYHGKSRLCKASRRQVCGISGPEPVSVS